MSILLQITSTLTDTAAQAAAALLPAAPTEQSMSLWEMASKGGPILYPIAIGIRILEGRTNVVFGIMEIRLSNF